MEQNQDRRLSRMKERLEFCQKRLRLYQESREIMSNSSTTGCMMSC